MKVQKRDGSFVNFDEDKIYIALYAANEEVYNVNPAYSITEEQLWDVVHRVCAILNNEDTTVEAIQDLVEAVLISRNYFYIARAYIRFRYKKEIARNGIIYEEVSSLLNGDNEYWQTENSNKDAQVVTTQRDYLAGILSTDIAKRSLLPPDVVKADEAGEIHEHDKDYMAQNALTNCCLVNLEDMLQNGTMINGVKIDPPKKLSTATTIATQIITAVASSQYGGTTITLSHLAPFVRKSKERIKQRVTDELTRVFKTHNMTPSDDDIESIVMARLHEEIKDAVQTFNYQINSMSTTNGQAPFLSVCMYLSEDEEYIEETALLIEEFLHQRILGMKNEKGVYVTPAFPKLLYITEDCNITEDSKYWYLTVLAAKCTAKRMVPDYISAKKMKEYKINKFGAGDVYGAMGCRSFLTPDHIVGNPAKALNYNPNKSKYYGRFNMGVTTINLADLAMSSKRNIDDFWRLFEERTELCHKGLRARIDRLEKVTSDVAPILWQDGAFARLEPVEKLHNLIHEGYSTASLGYAGLYECVKYMTGHSHTDKGIGEAFGLEVMQKLNDKCAQWKAEENIDYSLYGSPIESTTYKFAKALKKKFGDDVFIKLDGVDRNYITNSYHVPVFEKIDAFSKLDLESRFQKLSPGGAISYIETPNLQNNIPAILQIIQYIHEHIMYAELNTKSDYCHECGYDGEILIDENMNWYCPNCGNKDQHKMNVSRRTCGYLGTHFWNYGRTQEIKDRVIHLDE